MKKKSSWFLFSNGGKKHSNTLSVLLSISGLLENKRLVFGFPFPTPVALRLLRELSVVGPKLNFPGPLFLHFTHNGTAAKQRPCIWCEEESASEGLEFLLGEFWNGPEQKQQKNQTAAFSSSTATVEKTLLLLVKKLDVSHLWDTWPSKLSRITT